MYKLLFHQLSLDDHSHLNSDELGMLNELHAFFLLFKDTQELLSLFPLNLGTGLKVKKGESDSSFRVRARDEHEAALAKLARSFATSKTSAERSKLIRDLKAKR